MIHDFDYQPAVVELHASFSEFLHHIMRHRPVVKMFNKDAHLRVVAKAAILLFKSEVCGIKMHNE